MKRLMSFLLVLFFVISMASGVRAADVAASRFSDWDQISFQAEVAMLTDLGLLSGYADGTFRPYNCITRAEISKIIAGLLTDDVPAAEEDRFTDTAGNWARDYIAYCAEAGVLSGGSDGTFRPNDYVTIRELAKLLLTAMGLDPAPYQGAGWAEAVDQAASELGLYSGVGEDRSLYVTREQACRMISIALQCPVVETYEKKEPQYVLDSMMSPMSLLEYRFQVIPVTGVVEANAVADLRDGTPLSGNLIHIAGYTRDFLVAGGVANDAAILGRTVTVYARFYTNYNQVFGLPSVQVDESVATLDSAEELYAILDFGALRVSGETRFYKDFEQDDSTCLTTMVPGDTVTIIDHEGDGTLDLVMVTTVQTPDETTDAPETEPVQD